MGNGKNIKIFLALGEDDLENDKNSIGNFVRNLNQIYSKQNIYFKLVYNNDLKLDEEEIKDSQLFIILFGKDIKEVARKEFNIAYENFSEGTSPKITTYVKKTEEQQGQEVLDFLKSLSDELGHYYSVYDNIDTVKLNLIMQLNALDLQEVKMETNNGKILLNKQEVMKIDSVPMIYNNEDLRNLKKEYKELDEKKWKLKEEVEMNEKYELQDELNRVSQRCIIVKKEILNLEQEIINLESNFVKDAGKGKLTQRQIYARRCLERGKLKEAEEALSYDEINDNLTELESLNHREEIQAHVNELIQRANTFRMDITNKDRFKEIERSYDRAVKAEIDNGLDREATREYGGYLFLQKRYKKAEQLLKSYIYYQKSKGIEVDSDYYNAFAQCYTMMGNLEEAEKVMSDALKIQKSLNEDKIKLGNIYGNMAIMHYTASDYRKGKEEAENAIKLIEETPNADFITSAPTISMSYIIKGVAEIEESDIDGAIEDITKGVDYLKKLIEEHGIKNERYDASYALALNYLAKCYKLKGNNEIAETYFQKAYELEKKVYEENEESHSFEFLMMIGDMELYYAEIGDIDKVKKFLFEQVEIMNNENFNMVLSELETIKYAIVSDLMDILEETKENLSEKEYLDLVKLIENADINLITDEEEKTEAEFTYTEVLGKIYGKLQNIFDEKENYEKSQYYLKKYIKNQECMIKALQEGKYPNDEEIEKSLQELIKAAKEEIESSKEVYIATEGVRIANRKEEINSFLASSINEFKYEREEIGEFYRVLQDALHDNMDINLFECEFADNSIAKDKRKQEEYNEEIKKSDIFIVLIGKKVGEFTLEEYKVAKGCPNLMIYIFFKKCEADDSVNEFKKMLKQDKKHNKKIEIFDFKDTSEIEKQIDHAIAVRGKEIIDAKKKEMENIKYED